MGRTSVRNSIATYFTPPAITGLTSVFTSYPKKILPQQKYAAAGDQSGAAGVIFFERETEERKALGGASSGKKRVTYHVRLDIFFTSIAVNAETAMADFDTLIDNIKAKIRADRTFNDPTVVFQAGEEQLEGEYGEPVLVGDVTEIWGSVRFIVSEWLTT